MRWIKLYVVDLTGTVRVDEVRRNQIVAVHALSIGDSQRCILYRPPDGPPDVDHGKPPAQQIACLSAKKVTHPLWTGFHGVVIVDAGHRLTRNPGGSVGRARNAATNSVVEDNHAGRAGQFLEQ